MAKKIAIAIHKGGVGKTTSAKNIAAGMAMRGKRTLIVDLDEQANATKGMGVDPASLPATLNDLFANPKLDPREVIVATPYEGLHLLPGHPDLAKTETGMALQRADPNQPDPIGSLRSILEPLEGEYDYIIFDTPPSINYMTINALAAADELLIPAAASAYTEDGLTRTLEAYERAKKSYNPALVLRGVLVTRVKRTNASAQVFGDISRAYAGTTLPQAIVESTAVDEAEQLNQPVVHYDPSNVAAAGYMVIVDLLIGGATK
jgi:chromosome partitioning protein